MHLDTHPNCHKRVNRRGHLRKYTYLGCPLTKNRSPWCFRMCEPDASGNGFCGRLAPHGFKSHIQQAIADFKKQQESESAQGVR